MAMLNADNIALLDTNAVIRYILNDIPEQHDRVKEFILSRSVVVRYEVIAEAVFVFEKVYRIPRPDIADLMKNFLSTKNVLSHYPATMMAALTLFAAQNLDIVDSILCAFNGVKGWDVFTFDKEMNKLLHP
ncbi:MAG: PIN domain-containing protein [Chitinispirillales bacterium]|jgi:predicted nucleic-acid-binding protein|nr:PIN domain-containing protein [Chitinispirillales bacterium]